MLTGKYLNECLKKYPRFQLIHLVTKRVNELEDGAKPLVQTKLTSAVEVALQELAEGKIFAKPAFTPGKADSIPEIEE